MMATLRKFIPDRLVSPLARAAGRVKALVMELCMSSGFLTGLYYGVFSSAYRREQRAVMSGLARHLGGSAHVGTSYLLRRNVHRLEKGLVMRPRRTPFALDFIGDTVREYGRCMASGKEEASEMAWARDVLSTYFEVAGNHPIVERARAEFLGAASPSTQATRVPYVRATGPCPVTFEDFAALMQRRRSVRWFQQRAVPSELVDKAVAASVLAPSSCNRQPFQYRVFTDSSEVQLIASVPLGTKGFHHNIPAIVVVVGDLSAYFSERDRHGIYVDASLSAMGFMLALETLGLSSCPLNWPDIGTLERQMATLLKLQEYERVIMLLAVGFPDPEGLVAFSEKRSLSEVRTLNTPKIAVQ